MNVSDLAARVERLERANRRWRRGGLAFLVLLAGCVTMGQATSEELPEVLKARNIHVVGSDGKSRILLGVEDGGPAGIVVTDSENRARVMIGVTPDDSPVVRLSDRAGKLRATVAVDTDGEPLLELYDRGETARFRLATIDGQPGLALIGRGGEERVEFAVLDSGAAGLALNDQGGKLQGVFGTAELIRMLTEAEGLPSAAYLAICDKEGQVVYQKP